jgi:hydrogenase expression/formation protein HypC
MCLAIPGKLLDVGDGQRPRMATVSFGGVRKRVCIDWLPEVRPGDYVIVHVGFAIAKVDEEEAEATLQLFDAVEELETASRGENS